MPALKNEKHEAFAKALARGITQAAAYIEAGYTAKSLAVGRVKGSQLAKRIEVANRVAELRLLPEFQKKLVPKLAELPKARVRGGVRTSPATAEMLEAMNEKRESRYLPNASPDVIFRLCLLGSTDQEIMAVLRLSHETWEDWRHRYVDVRDAINRGRIMADTDVAYGMYRAATGYEHKAVKIFMPAGAPAPVYAPYMEHIPPNVVAGSLWLRNRHPDRWKERREVNIEGSLEHRLRQMTPEQREQDARDLYQRVTSRLAELSSTDAESEDLPPGGET